MVQTLPESIVGMSPRPALFWRHAIAFACGVGIGIAGVILSVLVVAVLYGDPGSLEVAVLRLSLPILFLAPLLLGQCVGMVVELASVSGPQRGVTHWVVIGIVAGVVGVLGIEIVFHLVHALRLMGDGPAVVAGGLIAAAAIGFVSTRLVAATVPLRGR